MTNKTRVAMQGAADAWQGPGQVALTCRFVGETMVTREYMRSGAASNRSGRASFIASSSADDACAGTPYHT